MSDRDRPYSKFFWSDYESDLALKQCSLAAQGLWMRLLCVCAKGVPVGHLTIAGNPLTVEGISRVCARPESEVGILVEELEKWGVFSRDRTGRIYCRRMVRDAKRERKARENGAKGGNPSLGNKRGNSARDNPPDKRGDKTHSPQSIVQRREEKEESSAQHSTPPGRDGLRAAGPPADRDRPQPKPLERDPPIDAPIAAVVQLVPPPTTPFGLHGTELDGLVDRFAAAVGVSPTSSSNWAMVGPALLRWAEFARKSGMGRTAFEVVLMAVGRTAAARGRTVSNPPAYFEGPVTDAIRAASAPVASVPPQRGQVGATTTYVPSLTPEQLAARDRLSKGFS